MGNGSVQNSLAWKNVANGFYANHSSGGNDWYNNNSYNNGVQFNLRASDPNDSSVTISLMGDRVHRMRNNLGLPNRNSNMDGGSGARVGLWVPRVEQAFAARPVRVV